MAEQKIQKKKQEKWVRLRHRIVRDSLYWIVAPITRMRYGVQVEKFAEQGNRPYLILMNHQTAFDQFFVAMAFRGSVYYLATEDIFSLGWLSSLLRYFLAPIPIKKQTTDLAAVRNCIRVAREGGTIAIAPEGNRTYHGRTVYINPSIVSMVKMLKLPVALFRIEGGYGVHPRWSDVVRRGKMRAYVSRVIEPEEYRGMSDDEIYSAITEGLYVDEAAVIGKFHHAKSAEYLERLLYVCPECGLTSFESCGDVVRCKRCGLQVKYTPTMELQGERLPFRFVADWYDYQNKFVNKLNVLAHCTEPVWTEHARLSEVIINKRKQLLKENVRVQLYGDRIDIDGQSYPFTDLSAVTVLGKNKLNIYHDGRVFQLKGDARFNAVKYVNFYFRYKNMNGTEDNGEFLGL